MLIFLDIDGVMVSGASWKTPQLLEDGFPMFTKKATQALASLLSPETRVILSTSHRDRYSIAQWKRIFKERGLHIEKLDKLAPVRIPSKRKDEIQEWFNLNPVPENFVIIDDDKSLYALPQSLKDHLVVTPPLVGLTPENLNEVVSQFAVPA